MTTVVAMVAAIRITAMATIPTMMTRVAVIIVITEASALAVVIRLRRVIN